MLLHFTDEQERLRARVRDFAMQEVAKFIPEMEEHDRFPAQLVREMGARGLMGLPVPAAWGGSGLELTSYMLTIEEIARVSATVGVILSVHTSVGTLPILYHGTSEQKMRCLPKLASGEWLGAFALTEPHAGSDASTIRTAAVRHEDNYVLNGTKVFITNAGEADQYVLFASVHNGQSGSVGGITAFLVDKDTPGFRVGKKEKKMGLHGSNTCELILEDAIVPAGQRLGEEGQGFAIAKSALNGGRIGIGAQALGIARAALTLSEQLLRALPHRERSRAAAEYRELAAQVEAAALLVYRAADMHQRGVRCTKEASMAKMFASDTAMHATTKTLQWCGSSGLAAELHAERLFRDAKVTQIYEGTNEIHRLVISGELLRGS
ncbi:acyl-CoA dehydrogenase family protein [Paenibacillus lignilyticus]|uniref:Acyl-CoA dehydrogenase family protein n=1 Tax=Paenibacillus lignilyticus TaxID=1172615 RepID=A0ABS5CKT3_9BACL|nr:acyl-CoA dehydrogenase family protein [Paenibacillus lignilyticus]MBP3966431.1 acyl-CoA dehydrogenase family protein [Paenibacillus lignilyticus]